MTSNFHFTIPVDQLATAIAERLNLNIPEKQVKDEKEEILLTRKETAVKLNISLPTLNTYTKKGILIGYKVGARVLYRTSEVEKALTEIKYSNF